MSFAIALLQVINKLRI